jgi:hypothetical protein
MKNYILMCDVIGSRFENQSQLIVEFKSCTQYINIKYARQILSPLTITLGDEFQGVISDLNTVIEIIIDLEEYIIENNFGFKLRYAMVYGQIDTKINKEIAYEMLGEGLTNARFLINQLKKSENRFYLSLDHEETNIMLNNGFSILQSIIDEWNIKKDFELISNLIKFKDYKIVAEMMNKERSLIWKREKSLKMKSYFAIKTILFTCIKL